MAIKATDPPVPERLEQDGLVGLVYCPRVEANQAGGEQGLDHCHHGVEIHLH